MANTFKKVYRKVANTGTASDYSLVAEVGANGVTLERMTGATSAANGKMGLVPAPTSGNQDKFLKGDATWATPENTTYGIATTTSAGLAPALGGGTSNFLRADGTWAAPTANVTSTDTITENSTAVITSGGVYAKLGLSSSENFIVNDVSYNTVKGAIDALNSKTQIMTALITLTSGGWSEDSYTATVNGVTTGNSVIVTPIPSDIEEYVAAGIICASQAADALTFSCVSQPEENIDVNVMIVK